MCVNVYKNEERKKGREARERLEGEEEESKRENRKRQEKYLAHIIFAAKYNYFQLYPIQILKDGQSPPPSPSIRPV